MAWGNFIVDGAVRDLTHLDPFVVDVTPKAAGSPTFRVLVTFSHHAFTREIVDGDDAARHFGPPHDVRCFCDVRHTLSAQLPDLIRIACGGRAYFPSRSYSRQRNFLLVEWAPDEPPYIVAFNLTKAQASGIDVAMFVLSAHPRPDLPARSKLDTISFATLVSKTANGEKVVRPPYRP